MVIYQLEPHIPFLSPALVRYCTSAWRAIFTECRKQAVEPGWGDFVLWTVDPNSAVVKANIQSSRDRSEHSVPKLVYMISSGVCEKLNDAADVNDAKLMDDVASDFNAWASNAIIKSFESVAIQKLYRSYNPDAKPFSILISKHDHGLAEGDASLAWRTDQGPKPDTISRRRSKIRSGKARKKTRAEMVKGIQPTVEIIQMLKRKK